MKNRNRFFHDDSVDNELARLVNEVKKYNVYNMVQRIACLNLFHQNQNMAVILDALIDAILQRKADEYTSDYQISSSKFRRLLNSLLETSLIYSVDPPENVFIENVMFYGDYKVFNGIDHTPAYNLQMIIRTIFGSEYNYPEEFKSRVFRLVHFILKESDQIANAIEETENNHEEDETKKLYIPAATNVEKYAQLIALDGTEVRSALLDDNELLEMMVTGFGRIWINDFDNRCFYSAPFLYDANHDQYIILNIGLLPSALFYWISRLAEKYGIQKELLLDYNNCTFYYCKKYLKKLGHLKIKEEQFDIVLTNEDYYKELITCVHNNQFLVMLYLCDDGENYKAETIHAIVASDKYEKIVNDRIEMIISNITAQDVNNADIYFILVLNSIGRGIQCGIRSTQMVHPLLSFNPMELMCISINEERKSSFLPRYIEAKEKFARWQTGILSELNAIELYTSQDYSFYMSDDIDTTDITMFVAPGDSIDYIKRALFKEDRRMVKSYDKNKYTEVVLDDAVRKIYVDSILTNELRLAYYLEFRWGSLWIVTEQILDYIAIEVYHTFADMVTYWLAESREYLDYTSGNKKFNMQIRIELSDETKEYYYDKELIGTLEDSLEIITERDIIILICTADVLRYLNYVDNTHEKEFMRIVINIIFKKIYDYRKNIDFLDAVFSNRTKKKVFSLDYSTFPYLEPVKSRDFHYVHKEDEEQLLDWIGNKILSEGNWSIGVVDDNDRTSVANKVVDILYERLQQEIVELNPYHLVEIIYDDLEKVLFDIMLSNRRYASDVACYPEKKEQILDNINKANRASMALRFLIEYVAAKPPAGEKMVGEGVYELLIAICSLIIEWAYRNDLFHYNVINTPIEFLQSKRIGMKQDEFQKMKEINERNRQRQLEWSSTIELRESYDIPHALYVEEIDQAFDDEFGYSLGQLQVFISGLREYSRTLPGDTVYVKKITEVEEFLKNYSEMLSAQTVEIIIEDLSIKERLDFLKPPQKYRKEDVYPWRFNRAYSFIRRPIIIRGDEIIWGNRNMAHMISYTLGLVYNGRLKAKKPKMDKLMGIIADDKGKEFNDLVYEMIRKMKQFEVEKKVRKVNRRFISDINDNTLGDIDVLIIDHKFKNIICAEVKKFSFSNNPYEMHQEYTKMFGEKKGYFYKHERRVRWCSEHVSDFIIQYKLEQGDWRVLSVFIVNEPLGSNEIYNKEINVISLDQLTVENIRNIGNNVRNKYMSVNSMSTK